MLSEVVVVPQLVPAKSLRARNELVWVAVSWQFFDAQTV